MFKLLTVELMSWSGLTVRIIIRAGSHIRQGEGIDERLEVRIARNVLVRRGHRLERLKRVVDRKVRV